MESEKLPVSNRSGDLCKWLANEGYLPELFSFLLKKTNASWFEQCCEKHDSFIVDCCLRKLLDLAIECTYDADESYNIINFVDRILMILREADRSLSLEIQESVLIVIYNFWDYVLEAVCYISVHIFDSLMKIHLQSCNACRKKQCQWILNVKKILFESSQYCSGRFRCILSFVKNFGLSRQIPTEIINEAYSCLTNWSHNSAAKELIVFDLLENLSDPDRCNIHKCNILKRLRSGEERSRSAIVERLLPALCNDKQLIDWIGTDLIASVYDSSDEYSLYAMLCLAKIFLYSQKKIGRHKCWQDVIGRDRMVHGLVHSKSYIRLSAWMVLTEDRRMSKPFSEEEIALIKIFLLASFAEQSPALRQKILAGLKKIFIRIDGSSFVFEKAADSSDILECYKDFIFWLKQISFNWLEKGANFNRRLMALNVLQYIYVEHLFCDRTTRSFFDRVEKRIRLTDKDLCLLIGCFDDSYQLCQSFTYSILTAPDLQILAPFSRFDFEKFLMETFHKILSIRSLDTEASGHRLKFFLLRFPSRILETFDNLFNICTKRVKLISDSLLTIATENGFLHSVLKAIEITVSCVADGDLLSASKSAEWEYRLLHNLPQLCFQVAGLVSPVVQALSPEGFLPETVAVCTINGSAEKERKNVQKGDFTQFLVACCWRAHKEITEIFHTLLTKYPLENLNECGFIEAVSKFYQEQLTVCRHCGAFGCVINGFEELCRVLWPTSLKSKYSLDLSIPDGWLQEILDIIKDEEDDNFCSARRSAGLPHLVCSILCTEPNDRNCISLKKTLSVLFNMERFNVKIQVHCINILRKLFADSRLTEKISWALEEALHKCITLYASPHWLLRNACAQLFAALLNQIFGVFVVTEKSYFVPLRNQMSAYKFFSRFSSVETVMFQQLSTNCTRQGEFKVFPVLTLLTHLYPSSLSSSNLLSKYIFPILSMALRCKNEKLRRLSVAALASDAVFLIHWCAKKNWSSIKQNQVNTLLLMLSYFNEQTKFSSLKGDISNIALKLLATESYKSWCCYNLGQFMELLMLCWNSESNISIHIFLNFLLVNRARISQIYQTSTILHQLFRKACNSDDYALDEFQSVLATDQLLHYLLWNELSQSTYKEYSVKIFEIGFEDISWCDDLTCLKILDVMVNVIAEVDECTISNEVTSKMKSYLTSNTLNSKHKNDYVYALRFFFLDESYWNISWMRGCARSEDFHNRQLAFSTLRCLLNRGSVSQNLLEISCLFLQDDETVIREEASLLLSQALHLSLELCPQLMLWLILTRFPSLGEKVLKSSLSTNSGQFFDPCAANIYAECRPYGIEYFGDVEKILFSYLET